jgi:hypothetical protein
MEASAFGPDVQVRYEASASDELAIVIVLGVPAVWINTRPLPGGLRRRVNGWVQDRIRERTPVAVLRLQDIRWLRSGRTGE